MWGNPFSFFVSQYQVHPVEVFSMEDLNDIQEDVHWPLPLQFPFLPFSPEIMQTVWG